MPGVQPAMFWRSGTCVVGRRHEMEGRLEFEVHSEWMRRTGGIGQMRPADAEGSKARQGVWSWVRGPVPLLPGQAACGTLGVGKVRRWAGGAPGHPMGTSGPVRCICSDQGLCLLARGLSGTQVPAYLPSLPKRVASRSTMPCSNTTSEPDEYGCVCSSELRRMVGQNCNSLVVLDCECCSTAQVSIPTTGRDSKPAVVGICLISEARCRTHCSTYQTAERPAPTQLCQLISPTVPVWSRTEDIRVLEVPTAVVKTRGLPQEGVGA